MSGRENAPGEVLEIYLMDDADARRHHFERVESLHPPFEELVAFAIAMKFHLKVLPQCIRRAREINLNRVIHNKIYRHKRLNDLRIFSKALNRRAHGGEIDKQGNTGEIL